MGRHLLRRAVLVSALMAAAAAILAFNATTALAGRPIDQQYGPPLGGSDDGTIATTLILSRRSRSSTSAP